MTEVCDRCDRCDWGLQNVRRRWVGGSKVRSSKGIDRRPSSVCNEMKNLKGGIGLSASEGVSPQSLKSSFEKRFFAQIERKSKMAGNHGGKRPGAGRPRTNPRPIEPTGSLNTENLNGLPLNQDWQRLLNQMVTDGVAAPDAVETMLSTALGNMCSLYGHQKVVAALLPVIHGIARAALETPRSH